MMSRKKENWLEFFNHEKFFFHFIKSQQHLFSIDNREPEYRIFVPRSGVTFEKPPRWIHWICQLKDDADSYHMLATELKRLYRVAVGDSFTHYPVRFPSFYQNVAQINVSSQVAHSSRRLKPASRVTLREERTDSTIIERQRKNFDEDIKALKDVGITANVSHTLSEHYGNFVEALELTIDTDDLFKYADCTSIQMRKETGKQYRALIRNKGQSAGLRSKLGLIIIDKDSDVSIIQSNPQAKRPHSLAATDAEITLPVITDLHFYKK